MNLHTLFRRVALTAVTSVAAFASGAAVEPAPAGAHCGEHDQSCGFTVDEGVSYWCRLGWWMRRDDLYVNDCSGTCYNGGTAGCCDSPEACANAPCKPGGCGGPCAYYGSYDTWTGLYC